MAFFRLDPINGEDDTIQRFQLCDELLILPGYCCDQRQKDLTQQGNLFA